MTPRGKVSLVGAGPGDPGLLTLKAARAIADCNVLVYDHLTAPSIVALAPPECEKIYVGKTAGAHSRTQPEINALLVRCGREGKRVARLRGGDVFVFTRGGEEAQALRKAGVPFEIVMGITSALAAPAYAGIPVTPRDHHASFTIVSAQDDPTKGFSALDCAKLASPAHTLIVLAAMGNLAGIAAKLREHGLPAEFPIAVVSEGTKPSQETLVGTLNTIVTEAERLKSDAPVIVVIGDVVRERERTRWFDATPLFGRRVLLTRPRAGADEFAAKLWEAGAEPLIAATIALGPPDDEAAAAQAVRDVRSYHWAVFTSHNGVDAFFERISASGGDARALGDVKVAAIGPKTAEGLLARGVRADFVPARFVGEDLAAGLLERTRPGDRVLIFRAQEARDIVPQALRAAGREVAVVAAYKTVSVHDSAIAAAAAQADVWTFTSAGSVRGLLDNVPGAAELAATKTIACIGPVTAEAAREAGLPVHLVPSDYTVDGLIEALAALPG